jgi:cobalt-zinc-cadmium efflux system membrane fusion protein
MQFGKVPVIIGGVVVAGVIGAIYFGAHNAKSDGEKATEIKAGAGEQAGKKAENAVDLNDAQVKSIEIGPVADHMFSQQRTAVGSIDFNGNMAVQVFSPNQGKIIKAYAEIGDEVKKGQTLYTIDSPDLVQAESTLIAAAGVAKLDSAVLAHAKDLYATQGLAQKDMEQAVSDQQTAEAALRAARDAVRIFGKSDAEIDAIVASRKIDPALVIASPITGRVTARAAQPGLLVQPGSAPAPYAVAELSTLWMNANVPESDSPLFHAGQEAHVKVQAYPDREFIGKVTVVGAAADPSTHTVLVRSEVSDPKHELRPGMFATYVIHTSDPVASPAMPLDGVAREGDGTMSVWVTTDKHHFTRKTVTLGMQQDGLDQIVSGLKTGETAVTKGAILLSNMLNAPPQD